jgi:DNA adenine methylase
MGSACLFFDVQPQSAILSDLNAELVNAFNQVKRKPEAVWRELRRYRRSRSTYYRLRGVDTRELDPLEAATRFIYLNRFCFNGLYRTDLEGRFNVPYAPAKTGDLPNQEQLLACSASLQAADLRACDFAETVSRVRRKDFVYLDPPFSVRRRRVFTEYCSDLFGADDLSRLAQALTDIDKKGAGFVVSYADCKEGREALAGWNVSRVRTKRSIAGFAAHRRAAYELLATNIEPAQLN